MRISILTNMITPYRAPFFQALAEDQKIQSLRILVCVEREVDRQWQVKKGGNYEVKLLAGFTLNLLRGRDSMRILHLRLGIFWELLRRRPDVLVIGDASWASYFAALTCKLYQIRYVVWSEITTTSAVSKGIMARLRQWMYRGADRLIAACGMAKDFLLSNGVATEKIHIVLNAVDNDYFIEQRQKWAPSRNKIRTELGVPEEAFCFIYVGQLVSRKRVVETVALLGRAAQGRPIHLLVAGTGPLEEAMRACAANYEFTNISFCGYAEPERLCQLYAAADALILLSDDEPWGMVVNEAILSGKGYIVTDAVAAGRELATAPIHRSDAWSAIDVDFIKDYIELCSGADPGATYPITTPKGMADEFIEALG